MCPKVTTAEVQAAVAATASRQFGVISRDQLMAAGLAPSGVRNWIRSKRLVRVHQGVYAVGHGALSNEGRWMAAVLACGKGAVLSHRSAAEHWRMLAPIPGVVHAIVKGDAGRLRKGIAAHRTRSLPHEQTTIRAGIPVTTPARTLTDLRRTVPRREFENALRQAEFLGLPADGIGSEGTRSEFESAFLALCRRHRVPRPRANVRVGPYEVDFLWAEANLIVETDGWQAHRGRVAFREDRERDLYLKVRGYEVIRLSYVQVTQRGAEVAAALRQLLGDRVWGLSGI